MWPQGSVSAYRATAQPHLGDQEDLVPTAEDQAQSISHPTAQDATGSYDSDPSTEGDDPRPLRGEQPAVVLSTWIPTAENFDNADGLAEKLHLSFGETLSVLGYYDLSVVSGAITISGAYLSAGAQLRVIAPVTEVVPQLRCVSTAAHVELLHCREIENLMSQMSRLLPLFCGLGRCRCEACLDGVPPHKVPSFLKLQSQQQAQHTVDLIGTAYPSGWKEILQQYSGTLTGSRVPIVSLVGPPNSGKSTLMRMLVNTLLTTSGSKAKKGSFVALLELDPDRTDVGLPGHVSLACVSSPMSEPSWMRTEKVHCCLAVGTEGNFLGRERFEECIKRLLATALGFKSHSKSDCIAILIQLPPWRDGYGDDRLEIALDVLPDSITMVLVGDMPSDMLQEVRTRKKAHVLPVSAYGGHKTLGHPRTRAQRNDMAMSLMFHTKDRCDFTPISYWRPYAVSYSDQRRDFLGFLLGGDLPMMYPNMLATLLNGTLVSIMIVDDEAPIIHCPVRRGTGDDIPYFDRESTSDTSASLHGRGAAKSIGVAMIRSIDPKKKLLLMIAPPGVGSEPRARIVLVGAILDVPMWAYLEAERYTDPTFTVSD